MVNVHGLAAEPRRWWSKAPMWLICWSYRPWPWAWAYLLTWSRMQGLPRWGQTVVLCVNTFWRHRQPTSSKNGSMKCYTVPSVWRCYRRGAVNQPIVSLAGGGWVAHCPGHNGWGGDGEQCYWESEAALRGSTYNERGGGMPLQCLCASSRGQPFPGAGRVLACKRVTTLINK